MANLAVLAMALLSLALVWGMQRLGRGVSQKLGSSRRRAREQAGRHFVEGAQLLARARSSGSSKLAKEAANACDQAIAMDPRDAAAHIVKGLALEQLGHSAAAVRSLTTALTPPASKSLSNLERAEALLKRATISSKVSSRRSKLSAIADLKECVVLNPQLASKADPISDELHRSLGRVREVD